MYFYDFVCLQFGYISQSTVFQSFPYSDIVLVGINRQYWTLMGLTQGHRFKLRTSFIWNLSL